MNAQLFAAAFVSGAALLALWLDVRYPGLAPRSLRNRLLAALVAGAILSVPAPPATFVTLLAVYLPVLAFGFLAMLWLLRLLAERRTF